jgi:hypothetical protein
MISWLGESFESPTGNDLFEGKNLIAAADLNLIL